VTAGAMRTALGSYFEPFLVSGLLCVMAAVMTLLIGRGGRQAQPAAAAAI
jgi:hypothetical protein